MTMMYEGYDRLRHDLEQNVRERGRRDLALDNPHASDEELWNLAAAIMPAEFGTWAEIQAAIDEDPAVSTSSSVGDMQQELREWYDEDRMTRWVSMRQLAEVLSKVNAVDAEVVYDCGGQWLLHVGPMFTDSEGVEVPAVTFGGDMTTDDQRRGTVWCTTEGMSVGTGDRSLPDAEQIQESITEKPWRLADLADVIVGVLGRELERRGYNAEAWDEHAEMLRVRIIDARIAAEMAFGAVLKAKFPELTGGDEDPGTAMMLERALETAIESLLDGNTPDLPWAAGTTPIILEPTAEMTAHATDLVQRAQQLEGRTLRPGNGGESA